MKTSIFSLLLLTVPALGAGAAERPVERLASGPGMKNASWGLSVEDASGKTLVARDPDLSLTPASTLKLFVTAAALDRFGPEKRFPTRLYYDGTLSGGVLNGDLYIKGGGDPSLGSRLVRGAKPMSAVFADWAAAVKAAGIRSIKGAVVGDDSAFDSVQPGSWAWEDIGNYYAAQPSALTVNDGLYELYFKPADKAGEPADVLRTDPPVPGLTFEDHMKTGPAGSGDDGYIYAFPGQFRAVLRGTIPQGGAEFAIKGALPDPALFAAQAFGAYLSGAGVAQALAPRRGAPPAGDRLTQVAETYGAPLKEIVRVTNKRSFNLYAELLLRQLGAGDPEAGLKAVRGFLAENGVDVSELKLSDACGLSWRDAVKARNFARLLVSLRGKKYFPEFYDSLVFPGDTDASGHVRKMGLGTPLEKDLRLKSGSINGVRSYAGYLRTKKGRTLAFAFIVNNYSSPGGDMDALTQRLLLELYKDY